jgi:outer membrane protein OmpA-like peptidoglycan-associated protein
MVATSSLMFAPIGMNTLFISQFTMVKPTTYALKVTKGYKLMKKIFVLAAFSALAFGSANAAPVTQDNAIDKSGKQVFDARGNCVFTKWDAKTGGCGPAITSEMRKVYFDFNSSSIKSSEAAELNQLAKAIKATKGNISSVTIVGHADQLGKDGYNQALSQRRANAVKRYLAGKGVRVKNVDLRAKGEAESVTSCDSDAPRAELIKCLAEDRRVEIELNYGN